MSGIRQVVTLHKFMNSCPLHWTVYNQHSWHYVVKCLTIHLSHPCTKDRFHDFPQLLSSKPRPCRHCFAPPPATDITWPSDHDASRIVQLYKCRQRQKVSSVVLHVLRKVYLIIVVVFKQVSHFEIYGKCYRANIRSLLRMLYNFGEDLMWYCMALVR
jgi:hypothetical protein